MATQLPDGTWRSNDGKVYSTQALALAADVEFRYAGTDVPPVVAGPSPSANAAAHAYRQGLARFGDTTEGRAKAAAIRTYVAKLFTNLGNSDFAQEQAKAIQAPGGLERYIAPALQVFKDEQAKERAAQFDADYDRVFTKDLRAKNALYALTHGGKTDPNTDVTISVLNESKPAFARDYESYYQARVAQRNQSVQGGLAYSGQTIDLQLPDYFFDAFGDLGRSSIFEFFQAVHPNLLPSARPDLDGTMTEAEQARVISDGIMNYGRAARVEQADRTKYRDEVDRQRKIVLNDLRDNPNLPVDMRAALQEAFDDLASNEGEDENLFVFTGGGNPAPLVNARIDSALLAALSGSAQGYAAYAPGDPFKTKANLVQLADIAKGTAEVLELFNLNPDFDRRQAIKDMQASPSLTAKDIVANLRREAAAGAKAKTAASLRELEAFHAANPDFDLAAAKKLVQEGSTASDAIQQVRPPSAVAAKANVAFVTFSNAARERFGWASHAQISAAFDKAGGDVEVATAILQEAEPRMTPEEATLAALAGGREQLPGTAVPGRPPSVPAGQAAPGQEEAVAAERAQFAQVGDLFQRTRDFDPKVAFRLMVGGMDAVAAVNQARQEFQGLSRKTFDPLFAAPLEFSQQEQAQFGLKRVPLGQALDAERFKDLLRLDPLAPDVRLANPATLENLTRAFAGDQATARAFANLTRVPDEPGEISTPILDLSKPVQDPAALAKILSTVTSQAAREKAMLRETIQGPRASGFMTTSTPTPTQPPRPKRTPRTRLIV